MNKRTTILIAALLMVIGVSGYIGYYYFIHTTQVSTDLTTETFREKPLTRSEIGNPVDFFNNIFSKKDYRIVVTSGKLTDANGNTFYLDSGAITATYFFQKGTLVRSDTTNTLGNFTVINKKGKIYTADNNRRSYTEMDSDNSLGQLILKGNLDSTFVGLVVKGNNPIIASSLVPLPEESTVNSIGYMATGVDYGVQNEIGKTEKMDIKIFIDTHSGLIQTASLKQTKESSWNTATIEYEEVLDIESIKNLLKDYTKIGAR